jgi:hypothetical protein
MNHYLIKTSLRPNQANSTKLSQSVYGEGDIKLSQVLLMDWAHYLNYFLNDAT